MNYCKDCRWYRGPALGLPGSWCASLDVAKEDPVHGFMSPMCEYARDEKGRCGPDGLYFERRLSFWRRIIGRAA